VLIRHDTPPALGLPTHRPGHALALGLDDQAWDSQCSPAGGSDTSLAYRPPVQPH